ncbi:MAG: fibrobacter succinogenes major paralogous domain-containing protein [Bacteroidales bacterium]|nr:fibrobacter succinogenes major paralogous domain-containing protein [Bacteroidales bacterium]
MKRIFYITLACSLFGLFSCHRDKKGEAPEGYVEYQGELLKKTEPLRYDSNGDGVIDEKDKSIEILGTNLNITQAPDGKPFYTGSGSTEGGESGEGSGEGGSKPGSSCSKVPVGEKLCYLDLAKYCNQNGGLYAFETTVNTAQSDVKTSISNVDANQNTIPDYIEEIRSASTMNALATTYSKMYSKETEQALEKAANNAQIGEAYLAECIRKAIVVALEEALYESSESVDIASVETVVKTRVTAAIAEAVNEVGMYEKIDKAALAKITESVSNKISEGVADNVATSVSTAILSQYEAQVASGAIKNVQGICPNGYHIPSDVEWMIFEQALGMSAADLTKCGETEITRGADAQVVKKMVDNFGFNFGGYASINGTYAQRGEAGVFWSSTTGTDMKGDYVWVRQIDTSYSGVVRFKMYEKSGLSIRCFKD